MHLSRWYVLAVLGGTLTLALHCVPTDEAKNDEGKPAGGGGAAAGRGGGAGGTNGGPSSGAGGGAPGGGAPSGAGSFDVLAVYDCGGDKPPGQETDPRCMANSKPPDGSVGAGPSFAFTGLPVLGGPGFLDAASNRLIVTLGTIEVQAQQPKQSVVIGVNLKTGDREIVSGNYSDAVTGPQQKGKGQELYGPCGVQPGPDGRWYAACDVGIIRIDPATGDRELIFDRTTADYPWYLTLFGNGPYQAFAMGPGGKMFTHWSTDTAYPTENCSLPQGVFTYEVGDAASWKLLMATPCGADNVGQGDDMPVLSGLAYLGDKLYGYDKGSASIFRIDATTGDRVRVSSATPANKVGDGPNLTDGFLAGDDRSLYISGRGDGVGRGPSVVIKVDATTGLRTALDGNNGPAYGSGQTSPVWQVPGRPYLILAQDQEVFVFDTETRNSIRLSH